MSIDIRLSALAHVFHCGKSKGIEYMKCQLFQPMLPCPVMFNKETSREMDISYTYIYRFSRAK